STVKCRIENVGAPSARPTIMRIETPCTPGMFIGVPETCSGLRISMLAPDLVVLTSGAPLTVV
ncbi:MAG TPA: hypothetical protein VG711_11575, partial [Phycisphaerales bacterium]|nr:hypothetical protein [Phycisphaerales bacterium]